MKILILVLSCLDEPFDEVMNCQLETWDSIFVDGVKTIYYYGGGSGFKEINSYTRGFGANVSEDYDMMHWKFLLTLREVINEEWDYIFRTNTSSYVSKNRLIEFSKNLPKEKCYCGIDGGGFASGAGFFLSKDCANICLNEIKEERVPYEDVYIGDLLKKNGIEVTPGARRFDFYFSNTNDINYNSDYHFRCKRYTTSKDEYINALIHIHKNIN